MSIDRQCDVIAAAARCCHEHHQHNRVARLSQHVASFVALAAVVLFSSTRFPYSPRQNSRKLYRVHNVSSVSPQLSQVIQENIVCVKSKLYEKGKYFTGRAHTSPQAVGLPYILPLGHV